MFRNHANHQARSAGTSEKARVKLNGKLLDWADVVFTMERRHADIIRQRFGLDKRSKTIVVLDIPDLYPFGSPELIEILTLALKDYL